MEFSPQGGNGMTRTSSDAVRRACPCQSRFFFLAMPCRIWYDGCMVYKPVEYGIWMHKRYYMKKRKLFPR